MKGPFVEEQQHLFVVKTLVATAAVEMLLRVLRERHLD